MLILLFMDIIKSNGNTSWEDFNTRFLALICIFYQQDIIWFNTIKSCVVMYPSTEVFNFGGS